MAEYIERDVILDALINKGQSSKRYKLGDTWELNYSEIRETIDSIPNANVQPIVKGKWNPKQAYFGSTWYFYECSNCKARSWTIAHNYCPNCGARMDGGT